MIPNLALRALIAAKSYCILHRFLRTNVAIDSLSAPLGSSLIYQQGSKSDDTIKRAHLLRLLQAFNI